MATSIYYGPEQLKAHIFADQLSGSISFDPDMVVSPTLPSSISSKTLFLLRHHLAPSLQYQYLEIENPNELWQKLKSRFDHQKTIFHPRALSDWTYSCVLDFQHLLILTTSFIG